MKNMLKTSIFMLVSLCLSSLYAQQLPKRTKNDPHPEHPKIDKDMVPVLQAMTEGKYSSEDGKTQVPWRLFIPKEASDTHKLPLIVFLHGAGSRGNDNLRPMDLAYRFFDADAQAENPCFIFAPQCPKGTGWNDFKKIGNKDNNNFSYNPDPNAVMVGVLETLDQLIATYPIDTNRIYITGMSMGGFGTWEMLYRRPDMFAAAIPICGSGDLSTVHVYKDVPIWCWHGVNDTTVRVENSRELIAALEAAGGSPKYSEIKAGHGSWEPAYRTIALHQWLFAQSKEEE
ncbi:prolyl oligopeptidase family serine peptidase [Kiritimatiellota bacterium B12222]|nr:prolyl oligopeptidase family serine peptidase [Kiritimatiellota bacterium B12222]